MVEISGRDPKGRYELNSGGLVQKMAEANHFGRALQIHGELVKLYSTTGDQASTGKDGCRLPLVGNTEHSWRIAES